MAGTVLRGGVFWEDAFDFGEEDAAVEFVECWPKVKVKAGDGWIEAALTHAKEHPLDFSGLSKMRTDGYQRFIETCYWMQADRGETPLFIPLREWADSLKVSQGAIIRYRQWGQEDGFLTLVKRHARAERKADEFRFNMGTIGPLTQETGQ